MIKEEDDERERESESWDIKIEYERLMKREFQSLNLIDYTDTKIYSFSCMGNNHIS